LAEDLLVHLFESVREILFNIVKHASTDRAHIDVRCSDGRLQISIADKGSGFNPGSLRSSGGSSGGFGLFTIRERLGLLGGELDVASAPGKGTRVTLTAPVVFAAAPDHTREQRIRLLIVDDHPVMRDGLTKLFSQETRIEVVGEASDGLSAVDLAVKLIPDVILMDIGMSGMNGIEATRIIRSRVPRVKILGLSMMDDEDMIRAMLGAGAAAYLSKSGSTGEIIKAVIAIGQSSGPKAPPST
jgi:CheY-like chemotaxis protein